jgi:hypothetical protein
MNVFHDFVITEQQPYMSFSKSSWLFQESIIPFQGLCVGESLVLFKERPNFNLYIKVKEAQVWSKALFFV